MKLKSVLNANMVRSMPFCGERFTDENLRPAAIPEYFSRPIIDE